MANKKIVKKSYETKLRIRVQAFEPKVLDKSVKQIIDTITRFDSKCSGPIPLPTSIKKFSVNRAPFVFKTSQEQFEVRTHARMLDIENPSPQVIEALGNISLPAGVSIEAQTLS